MENFNEVEYFIDVVRIKYTIATLMKKHHLIEEIVVKNVPENLNPFYGRIAKTGAYALEFSRGVPSMICTPYGGDYVETARLCRGYPRDYDNFLKDIAKTFGLVEMEPVTKSDYDFVGPVCVITKLPWKAQEKLPRDFDQQISMKDKTFGSKAELKQVNGIYQTVKDYFTKTGHAEIMLTEPKPKAKPLQYIIEEPKKSHCIIMGQIKQFLKHHGSEKKL